MVIPFLVLRFRKFLISSFIFAAFFTSPTLQLRLTALCLVLSFALFFLMSLTLSFMTFCAPFGLNVPFLLLRFLLGTYCGSSLSFEVLRLSRLPPALLRISPARSFSLPPLPLLIELGSFRLCLLVFPFRVGISSLPIFPSSMQSPSSPPSSPLWFCMLPSGSPGLQDIE